MHISRDLFIILSYLSKVKKKEVFLIRLMLDIEMQCTFGTCLPFHSDISQCFISAGGRVL